ncbi:MAG: hypothetical protein IJR13_07595 [Bacteroidales bacterium]|nr:hypothetical protein [Bacteroidales bacterium]
MKLPDGYEAIINPKIGTFERWGILISPSQVVIDNNYCGDHYVWGLKVIPFKNGVIPKGARIVQFKIQLSQKATIWQRIKWLFSNGKIEFEEVDEL